ncbi:MAG: mucoidy inhibitor MuiA family protein [Planctomycetota bacterium]|nr:mucoidy inhibitor MuiA family protein [Planctomycetota bacterium]MDA1114053.1 mucoidy inhibitor MuiA family protein [Planctomycetota bacterium]
MDLRLLTLCIPFLFVGALKAAPQGETIQASSTLERVTVYPGTALAERIVEVEATATGPMTLVVGPLPMSAQVSSFQTEVVSGDVVVQGLELRSRVGTPDEGSDADVMRKDLENLRWQVRMTTSDEKGIASARATLLALIDAQKTDPTVGGLLPSDLKERLDYLQAEMSSLDRQSAHKEREADELQVKIVDLENQLGRLQSRGSQTYREARVSVFVERVGTVRLRLINLADGAWWEPAYDVRVAPDLTGVNVGLVGQISQRTGEDWEGVELLLSTSMPNLGLDPPEVPLRSYGRSRLRSGTLMELGYAAADSELDSGLAGEPRPVKSKAPEVTVRDFGITTQFLLPGASTVRGNGEAHRFRIRELPLEVRPERYVVPSLSDKAYLRAKVTHTGEVPLLPGRAQVFLGPDYLGEASFPNLRQGDSTVLNLGIDPNLTVAWEMVEDERKNPGRFSLSSTSTLTRKYRATLRLSASARSKVTVLVEEAMPLQLDDRIEVELEDLQPQPLEEADDLIAREEQGIYRWRLVMAPGSTHSVRWGYVLSFDEDLDPVLNER